MKEPLNLNVPPLSKNLPKSLLRIGVFIISLCFGILFFLSWLLEYNDTVNGSIIITTLNKPIDIYTKAAGEIFFFIKDNQLVQKNENIAVIKNNADYKDIQYVKALVKKYPSTPNIEKLAQVLLTKAPLLKLGDLQNDLIQLLNNYKELLLFRNTDRKTELIALKKEQIIDLQQQIQLFKQRDLLLQKDLSFTQKEIKVKKLLFEDKVISEREFDNTQQKQFSKQYNSISNLTAINEAKLKIKVLEEKIIELEKEATIAPLQKIKALAQSFELLNAQILIWEKRYVLTAPISGLCIFSNYLQNHDFIDKEIKLATIIPATNNNHLGILSLSVKGSGKIKIGQIVNIQLNDFPPSEFGIIKGKITSITPIYDKGITHIQVAFPNGLKSTYGQQLSFRQRMEGKAEVITNKMSLFQRLMNQIKSAHKNK